MTIEEMRRLRRQKNCVIAQPTPEPEPVVPGRRQTKACAAPPAASPPPVFVSPVPPIPEPIAPLDLPDGLVIVNDAVEVTCADAGQGPVGPPSFIPAGVIQATFFFQDVVGISDAQLRYISALPDPSRRAYAAMDRRQLVEIGRLTYNQADDLLASLTALRADVLSRARDLALARLACYWVNVTQTVACPAGALPTPGAPNAPALNPAIVAAGEVQSTISQEDADAQAHTRALDLLGCVWGNAPVNVRCTDIGFGEDVPTDASNLPFDQVRRVGNVTIPLNQFFSNQDQADANARAREAAEAQLRCYYYNRVVNNSCAQQGKIGTKDLGPADVVNSIPGSTVQVPDYFIVSLLSTADADAQARSLALSLLDCHWASKAVTVECPVSTHTRSDGTKVTAQPSIYSLVPKVTLPAGSSISLVSQAAADEQAKVSAEAGLQCTYCNVEVPIQCKPPGVSITIPLDPKEVLKHPDWSSDITTGVKAGTYCMDTLAEAQALADSVGMIPARNIISAKTPCTYSNPEVRASCLEEPGVLGMFKADGALSRPISKVEENDQCKEGCLEGERTINLTVAAAETPASLPKIGLSPRSRPDPYATATADKYIIIAAGAITVTDANVPPTFMTGQPIHVRATAYAKHLAELQALASLDCFFENDPLCCRCSDPADIGGPNKKGVSPLALSCVKVPGAQFTSRASKAEANRLARVFGYSLLDCFYTNAASAFYCHGAINRGQYLTVNDHSGQMHLDGIGTYEVYGTGTAFEYRINGSKIDDVGRVVSYLSLGAGIAAAAEAPPDAEYVPGHGRPLLVEAGQFTSYETQEDCDKQMIIYAQALLDCFFENQAMEVRCGAMLHVEGFKPVGGEYGNMRSTLFFGDGTVSGDPVDAYSQGSITFPVEIPRSRYTSKISFKDATEQGLLAGIAQLNCFVTNEQITVTCKDVNKPDKGLLEKIRSTVVVPAGLYSSTVNRSEANAQARAAGRGEVECMYGNKEVTAPECEDPLVILNTDGVPPKMLAGEHISLLSQDDATKQAQNLVNAMLMCVNPEVAGGGNPGDSGAQTGCQGNCLAFWAD